MRGAPFGLRPCRVRTPLEMRVVGNDQCVVPHRLQDTVQRMVTSYLYIILQIIPYVKREKSRGREERGASLRAPFGTP